jgi:hypothetical protein
LDDANELVEFTPESLYYAILAINSRENRNLPEFAGHLSAAISEEQKAMESDNIPTSAPLRIVDYRHADNLIEDTFLSPNANDYFMYP